MWDDITAKTYGTSGLILKSASEVAVDKMGLWTGTCTFSLPPGRYDLVPAPNSWHPLLDFMWAERSRITMSPGLWRAVVEYAGVDILPPPVYELNPGVGTEPIETHPDFCTTLAGKPSAPLNGARWIDPKTGIETKCNTPGKFEFEKFSGFLANGDRNPFAGTTGFLEANQTTWQKSWTTKAMPDPGHAMQRIVLPPGNPPDYGGTYEWLEYPVQFSRRGNAYTNQQRWLLSGRRGWNQLIYT